MFDFLHLTLIVIILICVYLIWAEIILQKLYFLPFTPQSVYFLSASTRVANVLDPFVMKVWERNSQKQVGHLHREVSRVIKLIVDWGAIVDVKSTSDCYRRSLLLQGGLKIKCKVTVKYPMTPIQVTECYRALDEELYVEPKKDEILGSLILLNDRWRC